MELCLNGCGQPRAAKTHVLGNPPGYCGDVCRQEAERRYQAEYKRKHKEHLSAEDAARYRQNKEHRIAQVAAYRVAHPDRIIATQAKCYAKRKSTTKYKAQSLQEVHRRRARRLSVKSEPYTTEEIFARDKGRCGICDGLVDVDSWHLDHIVPLGPGDDTRANVRVTHPSCNQRKIGQDKRELAEWRATRV